MTPITGYSGKSGAWTATRSGCEGKGKTKREALAALNEVIDSTNAESDPKNKPRLMDIHEKVSVADDGTFFVLEYLPIVPHGKLQRTRLDADNREDALFQAAGELDCTVDELKRALGDD